MIGGQVIRSACGPSNGSSSFLILHGLFGSSRNWQTVGRLLADQTCRDVIAADLPAHGKSVTFTSAGHPQGVPLTWDYLLRDLEQFTSNHKNIILMGHSLGGQVAMQSLFRSPLLQSRVRALVVVDIAPRPLDFSTSPLRRYLERMIEIDRQNFANRPDAIGAFRELERNEAIVQFVFTNYGRLPNGRMGFLLPLVSILEGMLELSRTFSSYLQASQATTPTIDSIPTLFIRGERSDYVRPDEDTPLIRRLFPNARISTLSKCGHWPHAEDPGLFVRTVGGFVAAHNKLL